MRIGMGLVVALGLFSVFNQDSELIFILKHISPLVCLFFGCLFMIWLLGALFKWMNTEDDVTYIDYLLNPFAD